MSDPAGDPMMGLLLQRLAAPAEESGGPADPSLSLLSGFLEQRQRQLEEELQREEAEEQQRREEDRVADARRDLVQTARAQIAALAGELERLQARVDALAAALGSCSECWGEDESCRWCRGRGSPGFMPPEPQEFARLVVPAVRMHARLVRLNREDPDGSRVDTEERRSA